jgi:RNA recognition motif-containing protein
MASKLYVGRLSYNTTEDALRTLFEQYGKVISAQIIKDRATNQSKGFGFVEMENDADAQKAIGALDGNEFEGRNIMVNVARPQEDRSGGSRNDFSRRY